MWFAEEQDEQENVSAVDSDGVAAAAAAGIHVKNRNENKTAKQLRNDALMPQWTMNNPLCIPNFSFSHLLSAFGQLIIPSRIKYTNI